MEDNDILTLISNGSQKGLEALIDRYGGYIYAIIAHTTGGCAGSEDIEESVSDVLLALWRTLPGFVPEKGKLKNYIAAAARRHGINLRNKCYKRPAFIEYEAFGDREAPAPPNDKNESTVINAIYSLAPPDPEIFLRHYYRGDSLKEIGIALGMSERAVEGRLYRGKKKLRIFLGEGME